MDTERDLARIAMEDLSNDIDELRGLAAAARRRLRLVRADIDRARDAFLRRTYEAEVRQLGAAEASFHAHERALSRRLYRASGARVSLERLRTTKEEHADLMRLHQGMLGALSVGSEWQSPPFESAAYPTAGRHEGRVTEHHDDYKRDRHSAARDFERRYLDEYVETPGDISVRALMTACGMAAFTTILGFVCERSAFRPALAGRSMYHECRDLLSRSRLAPRIAWVDETDAESLLAAFDRAQPGAIFLDSLCNSAGLRVPEWPLLIEGLTRRAESVVHLIIDNTCTSTLFQPLALLTPGSTVRPLVFESLTKYAQFGLDRAAAGVIVALDDDAVSLDMLREHLGTNVSDHCAGIIPEPNRAALVRRLRRIERNALLLARHIAGVCAQTPGPVTGACYPGLETHPCHSHAAAIGFGGGILALEIEPACDRVAFQGRVVRALIAEARRRRAPLVAGASFGLNVTRVYRTGSSALASFVRISAGTEDRLALEDLKEVFGTVIRSLNREAAAPSPSLARLHQRDAMLAASGES